MRFAFWKKQRLSPVTLCDGDRLEVFGLPERFKIADVTVYRSADALLGYPPYDRIIVLTPRVYEGLLSQAKYVGDLEALLREAPDCQKIGWSAMYELYQRWYAKKEKLLEGKAG